METLLVALESWGIDDSNIGSYPLDITHICIQRPDVGQQKLIEELCDSLGLNMIRVQFKDAQAVLVSEESRDVLTNCIKVYVNRISTLH